MRLGFRITLSCILSGLVSHPVPVRAQAMTVFGGGSYARECFTAAAFASRIHSAGADDLTSCTNALQSANLSQRDLAATYVNRGIVYVAMKRYGNAAADYAKAVALEPRSGVVYVDRGNLSYIGKDYRAAIDDYSKALELDVQAGHVAYYNRGMAYEHMGQLGLAESDYRQAIKLASGWTQPRVRLDLLLSRRAASPDRQSP